MPKKTRRVTRFQRFMARVHAHPHARLLEFLVWGVPGILLIAGAVALNRVGWLSTPLALIMGVVGLSLVGWGAIPPQKPATPKPPPGRLRNKRRADESR